MSEARSKVLINFNLEPDLGVDSTSISNVDSDLFELLRLLFRFLINRELI